MSPYSINCIASRVGSHRPPAFGSALRNASRWPDLADDGALLEVCHAHPELRIESDRKGAPIVMSPTGWRSSNGNARVAAQLLAEPAGCLTQPSVPSSTPTGCMKLDHSVKATRTKAP
jgi:hypothetical protein